MSHKVAAAGAAQDVDAEMHESRWTGWSHHQSPWRRGRTWTSSSNTVKRIRPQELNLSLFLHTDRPRLHSEKGEQFCAPRGGPTPLEDGGRTDPH